MTEIKRPSIKVSPEALIDPAQIRARQVAAEEVQRFATIADRIIKLLIEEKITVQELPRVISAVTGLINSKIDEAEIERIIML